MSMLHHQRPRKVCMVVVVATPFVAGKAAPTLSHAIFAASAICCHGMEARALVMYMGCLGNLLTYLALLGPWQCCALLVAYETLVVCLVPSQK